MISPKVKKKISKFLENADSDITWRENVVQRHRLLGGWAPTTLINYNSGVSKLLRFAEEKAYIRKQILPLSVNVLYEFVVWAGKKLEDGKGVVGGENGIMTIEVETIKKYLTGIKCWHLVHNEEYPRYD
jgi:hypothetical protein